MRTVLIALASCLVLTSCRAPQESLPVPAPPSGWTKDGNDPGYPIKPRPACTEEVNDAHDADIVARIAARGGTFTCGGDNAPPPLDRAILADDAALVRALLEAHSDPTARWRATTLEAPDTSVRRSSNCCCTKGPIRTSAGVRLNRAEVAATPR